MYMTVDALRSENLQQNPSAARKGEQNGHGLIKCITSVAAYLCGWSENSNFKWMLFGGTKQNWADHTHLLHNRIVKNVRKHGIQPWKEMRLKEGVQTHHSRIFWRVTALPNWVKIRQGRKRENTSCITKNHHSATSSVSKDYGDIVVQSKLDVHYLCSRVYY